MNTKRRQSDKSEGTLSNDPRLMTAMDALRKIELATVDKDPIATVDRIQFIASMALHELVGGR